MGKRKQRQDGCVTKFIGEINMVTGEIIETKIAESIKLGLDSIFLKVESKTDKKELEHLETSQDFEV